jgi:putative FmdB family regulatory protein
MTYEYLCTACGHAWEADQTISEAPLKSCPSCQQETAKRQVSGGAGFILKGGGWYSDLYSSAKKSDGSESKSGESKSGESKSGESKSGESKSSDTQKDTKKEGSGGGTPGKTEPSPAAT